MQKKLAIAILSLFIIFIFSFVILRSWSLGPEDNYFNRTLRPAFAAWPLSRKVLALHFDGDAKSDYLSSRYSSIEIEVDAMAGEGLPQEGLAEAVAGIEKVTGKRVEIRYSDNAVPYQGAMTDEQLKSLVEGNRWNSPKNKAFLYLLLASSKEDSAGNIGTTYGEDGIVVYMDALRSFSSRTPDLLTEYFASTVLHEFGHQIGLSHNAIPGCLMNPEVEGGLAGDSKNDVVKDFCYEELRQINEQR